jgi:aconitate hydratase
MTSSLAIDCRAGLISGRPVRLFSFITALSERGLDRIPRLPVSLRIVLESLLRNCDGHRVTDKQVLDLAGWQPHARRTAEIPFVVGRIVLQDVAGIPLLGDLAAMRAAANRLGLNPTAIQPGVPVDMVIDHSLTVDYHGTTDATERNMRLEFERNEERFKVVKWAMQAFKGIRLVPPDFGILHQVNLEFFANGLLSKNGIYFPIRLWVPTRIPV